MWTLDLEALWPNGAPFRHQVRYVNQMASGGSFVAIFTIELFSDLDAKTITLLCEPGFCERSMAYPYIADGLQDFLTQRIESGRPAGHLLLNLVDLVEHPVDFKPFRFREAMRRGLDELFALGGIPL